jgi:hypothetical protein
LRNRFQKARTIDRWACVLVSTQKPNENQLSIAKQFVDQFPYVNSFFYLSSIFEDYF